MPAGNPDAPASSRANGEALPPVEVIFGSTPAMLAIRERIKRLASANIPVLIQGESGAGKGVLAQLIHTLSAAEYAPFVKVRCPAIPGSPIERDLFGPGAAAFAASNNGHGPGELANGGTLFLDEIAELEPGLQSKLLQLLQDGDLCGSNGHSAPEVRLVCATNRQLEREVERGVFRQDLYYRINVVCIQVPPLRQRKADVTMLADHFLTLYSRRYERTVPPLSQRLLHQLRGYQWPGNVRELENLIKRYVIFGSEEAITSEFRTSGTASPAKPMPAASGNISLKTLTRNAVRELESKIILDTLEANRWNRRRAARSLNISYRAFLYKLKQANAAPEDGNGSGNGPETNGSE